ESHPPAAVPDVHVRYPAGLVRAERLGEERHVAAELLQLALGLPHEALLRRAPAARGDGSLGEIPHLRLLSRRLEAIVVARPRTVLPGRQHGEEPPRLV